MMLKLQLRIFPLIPPLVVLSNAEPFGPDKRWSSSCAWAFPTFLLEQQSLQQRPYSSTCSVEPAELFGPGKCKMGAAAARELFRPYLPTRATTVIYPRD